MAAHDPAEVLTPTQARQQVGAILRRFRADGIAANPVLVGANRSPEAVILPYELYIAATAAKRTPR